MDRSAGMQRRGWHLMCLATSVSEPGDVVATRIAAVPVVLVRGPRSELRGFVNICRHRAHPVVASSARHTRLRCRYHGWCYDLDGRLLDVPRAARGVLDRESLGLLPVATDVRHGAVFASLEAKGAPDRATAAWREALTGSAVSPDAWRPAPPQPLEAIGRPWAAVVEERVRGRAGAFVWPDAFVELEADELIVRRVHPEASGASTIETLRYQRQTDQQEHRHGA